MKKVKITMEMGDETVSLSLNTTSTLAEVLTHITKIREEETIESLIEKQLAFEIPNGNIYESPDKGETIYKRKIGESKRELISKKRFRTETRHDMGGSYDVMLNVGKWICDYCGEDTDEVENDYLIGTNHLSCVLKNEREKKEK